MSRVAYSRRRVIIGLAAWRAGRYGARRLRPYRVVAVGAFASMTAVRGPVGADDRDERATDTGQTIGDPTGHRDLGGGRASDQGTDASTSTTVSA